MFEHASSSGPARRSPVTIVLPAAITAVLVLAACGGGGGSSGTTPPVTAPSPIGSATPQPSAAPTTKASPTPVPSATPTGPATPAPSATPAPAPTATPVGNGVALSPASLSFTAAGTGAPTLSVTAAQIGNTLGFALTSTTCAGIVSVAPASGAGPFVFTPLAAGACSYTVTGIGGYTAQLPISVTTTVITQQ
jgi:hypothetical protein